MERLTLDDAGAAALLGVSIAFLRKDRITKRCVPFTRVGGRVLYNPDSRRAMLAANEVGGPEVTKTPRAKVAV